MAAEITRDYAGKNPTMICLLKGAVMFYSDLLRHISIPLTMDFMAVSSYGNKTKSSGEVEIRKDLSTSIEKAKEYISGALAAMLDLGQGSGPMDHAFALTGAFAEEAR